MRRFLIIAFTLIASIALQAKGTTVKLTLTGPGLAAPHVETPIYTVSFHVQSPEWMRRPVTAMYAVSVARDAQDVHWHRPPHAWASGIAKLSSVASCL